MILCSKCQYCFSVVAPYFLKWKLSFRELFFRPSPFSRATTQWAVSVSWPISVALSLVTGFLFTSVIRSAVPRTASCAEKRWRLICDIWEAVERWETVCVEETVACCEAGICFLPEDRAVLSRILGDQKCSDLHFLWKRSAKPSGGLLPSSSSFLSSKAFSNDFTVMEYVRLCLSAHNTLQLEMDRKLLLRLDFVLQYCLFRRLCAMEESRAMHAMMEGRDPYFSCCFREPISSIYGSPLWLMKNSSRGGGETVFCLPWSYFPVEVLMIHKAQWLFSKDLEDLIQIWKRTSLEVVRDAADQATISSDPFVAASSMVSIWFYCYATKLYTFQLQLSREYIHGLLKDKILSQGVSFRCPHAADSSKSGLKQRTKHLVIVASLCTITTVCLDCSSAKFFSDFLVESVGSFHVNKGNELLSNVSRHIVLSFATAFLSVIASNFRRRVTEQLVASMNEDFYENICNALLSADLAFLERFSCNGISLNALTERTCRFLLHRLDSAVRNGTTMSFQLARLCYYQEFSIFFTAVAVTVLTDVMDVPQKIMRGLRLLKRNEGAALLFPTLAARERERFGLAVLTAVLAEERHVQGGDGPPYPVLSLLVCSQTTRHDWWLPESPIVIEMDAEQRWRKMNDARKMEEFYRTVRQWKTPQGMLFRWLLPYVESMQLSVDHILRSILEPGVRRIASLCDSQKDLKYKPYVQERACELDPVEHQVAMDPIRMEYLPSENASESLFLFKQLGLESLMAYKTWQQQKLSHKGEKEETLMSCFNDCFFTVTRMVMDFVEVALLTGLTSISFGGQGLPQGMIRTCNAQTLLFQRSERVAMYKTAFARMTLKSRAPRMTTMTFEDQALLQAYELLHCIPCTISDASARATHPELRRRRQIWRRYLEGQERRFQYDDQDRIVGGLQLEQGVELHNVTCFYPLAQSRASPTTANNKACHCVAPSLQGVSVRIPANGITGIIGRSGSGKSTVFHLLRRLYEPILVLRRNALRDSSVLECASVPNNGWTWERLREVVDIHLVDHQLPLPPLLCSEDTEFWKKETKFKRSTCFYAGDDAGYITLDGIPASCFSVLYLRQWLIVMEQSPKVLTQKSFEENIRFVFSNVRTCDVQKAAEMSGCTEFISRWPLKLQHKVGSLSGGELQRLVFARVLAATYASLRCKVLSSSFYGFWGSAVPRSAAVGLLLDEPTSQLDAVHERQMEAYINDLANGVEDQLRPRAMVLIISHRFSAVRSASHVIVLQDGRVEAQGELQLVLKSSTYARRAFALQCLHKPGLPVGC